jgi:hypothetical protein
VVRREVMWVSAALFVIFPLVSNEFASNPAPLRGKTSILGVEGEYIGPVAVFPPAAIYVGQV